MRLKWLMLFLNSIISVNTGRDFYKILGIPKEAKQSDIKKAFYSLSKIHHPDVSNDEEAFMDIRDAYEVLSDKEKRKKYDLYGEDERKRRPRSTGEGSGFGHFYKEIDPSAFGFFGQGFGGFQRLDIFEESVYVEEIQDKKRLQTLVKDSWVVLLLTADSSPKGIPYVKDFSDFAEKMETTFPCVFIDCEKLPVRGFCESKGTGLAILQSEKKHKISSSIKPGKITEWVSQNLPNECEQLQNIDSVKSWASKNPQNTKAIVISDENPPALRKTCWFFKKSIDIGIMKHSNGKKFLKPLKLIGPIPSKENFPLIVHLLDPETMEAELVPFDLDRLRSSERVLIPFQFFASDKRSNSGAYAQLPVVREYSNIKVARGECVPTDSNICVFLFYFGSDCLEGFRDAKEKFEKLGQKHQSDPIRFFTLNVAEQENFYWAFRVDDVLGTCPTTDHHSCSQPPILVVFKPKRLKYQATLLDGDDTEKKILAALENVNFGNPLPKNIDGNFPVLN